MSRRRSNRKALRQADNFPVGWAIVGGLALVAVLGGFGWLYFKAVAENPHLDQETSCPTVGPSEQVLVLVDLTDPIGSITQADIVNQLSDAANAVRKGGLFELRVLEPGPHRTRTLFAACNPGDGSELDHWTGNPDAAMRRWKERFDGPLKDAMTHTFAADETKTSPIMAGIQQIAVDRLGTKAVRSLPNKLIVVSDLIENTEKFSMYQNGPDYVAYQKSEAAVDFATDLAGANVETWLVRRGRLDTVDLAEFWAKWIVGHGGSFNRAVQLQGSGE